MKLLVGNGRTLDVRDVGPCLMQVRARPDGPPIKVNGYQLVGDDEARETLRELLGSGLYDHTTFKGKADG